MKLFTKRWKQVALCLCMLVVTRYTWASPNCRGHFVNPITDIDWNAIFPITIGNQQVVKGRLPDTHNPSSPICACERHGTMLPGLTIGFWEPIAMVDITHTPFCLVNLGGVQLRLGHIKRAGEQAHTHGRTHKQSYFAGGEMDSSLPTQGGAFYQVHWFRYPLLFWLKLVTDLGCIEHGDFDSVYLSELDPSWRDDALNSLLHPEFQLYKTRKAQLACSADAVAANTKLPLNRLFWCAGSHGTLYPTDGWVSEAKSGAQVSTLLVERVASKLHQLGLLKDSLPVNGPKLCYLHQQPIMPKNQYRYQLVNPIHRNAQPFGRSTVSWESGIAYPGYGDHFGYLVFRKRNCCLI